MSQRTITDKSIQRPTSEQFSEIFRQLQVDMVRFVVKRQETLTDKDAALSIGVSPHTVKGWKQNGYPIDEAVALMAADGVNAALEMRRRALTKAMAIKVKGLDSTDEALRQRAATEIIEWELGKASQRQEHLLKSLNLSLLTVVQLERIAAGEDPLAVLATPGEGGT